MGDLCRITMKVDRFSGEKLRVFHPTSESEKKELIFNFPNKSCHLDPLPTWLLKKCIYPLLQPITAIINRSLAGEVMPFGTEHQALSWMKSYFSDSIHRILIAGCISADSQLDFCVPQGSVLGPKMYCNALGDLTKRHGFKYHC